MVSASTLIERVRLRRLRPRPVSPRQEFGFRSKSPRDFFDFISPPSGLNSGTACRFREPGVRQGAEFRNRGLEARVYRKLNLKYAVGALREAVKAASEMPEVIDGPKYVLLEAEGVEKGIEFLRSTNLRKRRQRGRIHGDVTGIDRRGALLGKLDLMITSFVVK